MKQRKKYVIIGGGVASIGCIDGIRSVDKDGKIILICGENRTTYCRPLISYYLQGKTDFEKMKYRPDNFYCENSCEIINAKAKSIDKKARTVSLDNGDVVSYDFLCASTGSSAFVPPFAGLDTVEKRYCFMTEDDALAIEKNIDSESRVLIIGAGLIGLKCAEGLCERVKSITVCDLAERVLSSILDDTCASIMQKELEEHGVSFMLGDSAERFEGNTAIMKKGSKVEFDVLITAVGVRPNISLIKDCGGECDRGIIVDNSMKTSLENIYAAGDCAQGYDASIGEKRILAILPNAYMQGNCAGKNMAGGNETFDCAIPMNAIGFFGVHALTAGSYQGEMHETRSDNSIKRLFVKDGVISGFMLIGDIEKAGIYTAMVREKTPVDANAIDTLMKSPSLAVLSPETRIQRLGGVV